MLPHEAQDAMAKVLFFIFAISLMCFAKARAELIPSQLMSNNNQISIVSNNY
jgi:hypothetical protein